MGMKVDGSPPLVAVEDMLYEEDVLRNAFSLKYWLRYVEAKRKSPPAARNMVFERALKQLPGSYKLWRLYLADRLEQIKGQSPLGSAYEQTVIVFERALVSMHKMPRIWLEYLGFLVGLPRVTQTRRAFDRALHALPVTQHERVWPLYLRFVSELGVVETAVRVYRRHLKVGGRARAQARATVLRSSRASLARALSASPIRTASMVPPRLCAHAR
jgi:pre-mRNA-splicing factor SYF1